MHAFHDLQTLHGRDSTNNMGHGQCEPRGAKRTPEKTVIASTFVEPHRQQPLTALTTSTTLAIVFTQDPRLPLPRPHAKPPMLHFSLRAQRRRGMQMPALDLSQAKLMGSLALTRIIQARFGGNSCSP